MNSFQRLAAAAAAIFAATAAIVPASAAEIDVEVRLGWFSTGTDFTISEGHFYWVGSFGGSGSDGGAGSVLDDSAWQCPSWLDIDFTTGVTRSGGYCIATTESGDSMHWSWSCESSLEGAIGEGPRPLGPGTCNGEGTILGGTGALEGVTGTNAITGTTLLFHPNGDASGFSLNHFTLTTAE